MEINQEQGAAPEIPQEVVASVDTEQLHGGTDSEFESEFVPEISPELTAMSGADPDEKPDDEPAKLKQSDIEKAANFAADAVEFAASGAQSFIGKNYGVDREVAREFGKGVAPFMVKYGLTDFGEFMSKYGPETQAVIATAGLGFGIYQAHLGYKQEAAQAKAQQKEAATHGH